MLHVTRQTKNCSVWSAFESVLPLWWWPAHLSRDNSGGSATHRFGIPHNITSDNGKAFTSHKMEQFKSKYKIKWNYSTGYYPQANGVAEAFNKTLGKILKKIFCKYRRDWHDRLSEALWAYRVTVCTPTQATPYVTP